MKLAYILDNNDKWRKYQQCILSKKEKLRPTYWLYLARAQSKKKKKYRPTTRKSSFDRGVYQSQLKRK